MLYLLINHFHLTIFQPSVGLKRAQIDFQGKKLIDCKGTNKKEKWCAAEEAGCMSPLDPEGVHPVLINRGVVINDMLLMRGSTL